MSVVLKFPLDRVPRPSEPEKVNNLHSAQIIVFDGVRYSRGSSSVSDGVLVETKPANPG